MPEFFIDKLDIQNFRGIPGYLSLDLSAPLTLITAANGSGKSSVCQAIEWLLAGASDNVTEDSLRCKYGKGETYVRAECRLGDTTLNLMRTPDSLIHLQDKKDKKLSDKELLNLMTQGVAGFGKSGESRPSVKKEWLRRSRWLYSSALSMLVDNEYAEHRQQIFANILGYGHLLPVQKNLRIYFQNLPSDRELVSQRASLQSQIHALESAVRKDDALQGQVSLSLKQFSELMGYPLDDRQLPDRQCENAAMFLAAKHQALVSRQIHLNTIKAGWASLESADRHEKGYRGAIDAAQKTREPLLVEVSALRKKMLQDTDSLNSLKSGLARISEQVSVMSVWDELAKRLSDETATPRESLSADLVHLLIPATRLSDEECRAHLIAWQRLVGSRDRWEGIPALIAELSNRVLAAPQEDSLLKLQHDVDAYRRVHADKVSAFNALSSEQEQLQALGLQVAESRDSDDCPLCGTPHGSHEKLLGQLKSVSETAGSLALHAQAAVAVSLDELKKAEHSLHEARRLKQHGEQARRDISRLEDEAEAVIKDTGIRRWQPQTTISGFIKLLGDAVSQGEMAVAYSRLMLALNVLESHAGASPDTSLQARVTHAEMWYQEWSEKTKQAISRIRLQHERDDLALQHAETKVQNADNDIREYEAGLSRLSHETSGLMKSWKALAPEDDISGQRRDMIAQSLNREAESLDAGNAILEQVKASLKVSSDMRLHEELKASLIQVEHKLALREQVVKVASQTRDAWDRHIDDVAKQSLDQLILPASELFSRMHANEVYQALSMGREKGAFCWEAVMNSGSDFEADNGTASPQTATLDAQTHFSQGQRQDLALSLFLARARSLSGSFFLDEPVAHLDDLNRVAMMDIFRMLTTSEPGMRLVLTTASQGLRRHFRQKFSTDSCKDNLRIITLQGNPLHGVSATYS